MTKIVLMVKGDDGYEYPVEVDVKDVIKNLNGVYN